MTHEYLQNSEILQHIVHPLLELQLLQLADEFGHVFAHGRVFEIIGVRTDQSVVVHRFEALNLKSNLNTSLRSHKFTSIFSTALVPNEQTCVATRMSNFFIDLQYESTAQVNDLNFSHFQMLNSNFRSYFGSPSNSMLAQHLARQNRSFGHFWNSSRSEFGYFSQMLSILMF